MKASITKSTGNTYLILVDEKYYDIVKWRTASSKIKEMKVVKRVNSRLDGKTEEININPRSDKSKENSIELKKVTVNWTDKRRTIGDIIDLGISNRVIRIQRYKELNGSFYELENPIIKYYLKIDGLLLQVHKDIFDNEYGDVVIEEARAW